MKIGVFDSGVGGLNVLKELIKKYPKAEYIYFGDTLHLPYGEKTKEELIKLGSNIINFFEEQNVDVIIIACGTCSGLVEEYRMITDRPIYDVITPTVEYVKSFYKNVGLLATPTTINSGIFEKKIQVNGIDVKSLACPNFVPYIEKLNDNKLDINNELKYLYGKDIEAVILGCTHYPLLESEIYNYLHVPCIDMGKCLAETIKINAIDNFSLTIYMSKINDRLIEQVKEILNIEVELIEKILV